MVTVLLKLVCEWILYFCPQKHLPTYYPPAHPLSHTTHIEISSYPCPLQILNNTLIKMCCLPRFAMTLPDCHLMHLGPPSLLQRDIRRICKT